MSVDFLKRNLNFINCEPHFEIEESSIWEFGVPLPEISEGETNFYMKIRLNGYYLKLFTRF